MHKSDRGGVRVGLPDAASLHAAALDMERALAPERLFVERTAIVARRHRARRRRARDARFGPVVLVGLGGILVEALRDTALALAPLDAAAAERLLRSLRARAVLRRRARPARQWTSPPPRRAIAALGVAMAAHPEIAELEVNPLLVTPHGADRARRARRADGIPTPNPNE